MSSTEPRPFLSSIRWRTVSRMSLRREHRLVERAALLLGQVAVELVVELQTADRREVVALGIEEQVVEELLRRLERRRIAGRRRR